MTPEQALKLAEENDCKLVDVKFCDFIGQWQHFTVPMHEIDLTVFEEGLGFDGSSIRGWKNIDNSDMLVMPDPSTAMIDPFCEEPTLSLVGDIRDPISGEGYERDPRSIARKAEAYLKSTGIGDTAHFGPELEFFIFDDVRYKTTENSSYYFLDSEEAEWNTDADECPNLGHKIRKKAGYIPVAPIDQQQDLRSEMVLQLEACGITVERQHHEVATAGQAEIDMRFSPLLHMADQVLLYKYIVKNVARRNGKSVTFMPKPLFGDNGTGQHTHQSIWKGGKPLFYGDGYANLSQIALHYIGGIIKHGPALAAITNPSTNSYKRLVPGYEAPVSLAYSSRNRSASLRIPTYSPSPKAKRVEVRFPDPTCNPYLAFAAMLMAGLDGIENKIDPGEPMDKNLYDLPPEELAQIPSMPGSLHAALNNLENDHAFLLKGDVFTEETIRAWIDYKRINEADPVAMRPHPYEFFLYYDC
ncbi:MAG: type I glutamate--ammonia ligase [Deltaproteobacteria bacterium]|nr:type I glutamate--ammonia ligase [Deltaproteobacteria bacterium]PIU78028.1 MAG: type I glutamate--ammonia ligase [Nitrospirae bacterium CG06_land_8_20_14_3_00_70_43]